jgi:hypothetical protein
LNNEATCDAIAEKADPPSRCRTTHSPGNSAKERLNCKVSRAVEHLEQCQANDILPKPLTFCREHPVIACNPEDIAAQQLAVDRCLASPDEDRRKAADPYKPGQ